ncbi:MAG: SnoaL-like polyketide cyclase [Planctomycetaceae bacterium]|nr:SnoaL-like polyketide cyclase [Planctomycetaceae bacterium]
MSTANIQLVQRWFEEVWNQRRAETIDELLTADSVCYADDGPLRGPEEFRSRQHTPFISAFPDLRVEIEATISQGDQVVVRWNATAQHAGNGLGIPATLEKVTFRGVTWILVCDGKLAEGWQYSNIPEVLRELATKAVV